jgi:hypothetical protein
MRFMETMQATVLAQPLNLARAAAVELAVLVVMEAVLPLGVVVWEPLAKLLVLVLFMLAVAVAGQALTERELAGMEGVVKVAQLQQTCLRMEQMD